MGLLQSRDHTARIGAPLPCVWWSPAEALSCTGEWQQTGAPHSPLHTMYNEHHLPLWRQTQKTLNYYLVLEKKYIEIIVLASKAASGRIKAFLLRTPSLGAGNQHRPQNHGKPWHGETAMSKRASSSCSREALLCSAGSLPFPLCSSHGQASPVEPPLLNFWLNASFGSLCCQIGRVGSGGYGWDAVAARKPLFTAHSGRKRALIPRKLFCVPEQPRRGGKVAVLPGGPFPLHQKATAQPCWRHGHRGPAFRARLLKLRWTMCRPGTRGQQPTQAPWWQVLVLAPPEFQHKG